MLLTQHSIFETWYPIVAGSNAFVDAVVESDVSNAAPFFKHGAGF